MALIICPFLDGSVSTFRFIFSRPHLCSLLPCGYGSGGTPYTASCGPYIFWTSAIFISRMLIPARTGSGVPAAVWALANEQQSTMAAMSGRNIIEECNGLSPRKLCFQGANHQP